VCSRGCGFEYELIRCFAHIALDFREWLGGEARINAYCKGLAIRGGRKLAEILGTEYLDRTPNHELTLNMVRNHLTPLRLALRAAFRSM
jgi:hypothetical protein